MDSRMHLELGIMLDPTTMQMAVERPLCLNHTTIALATRSTQRDLMSVIEVEAFYLLDQVSSAYLFLSKTCAAYIAEPHEVGDRAFIAYFEDFRRDIMAAKNALNAAIDECDTNPDQMVEAKAMAVRAMKSFDHMQMDKRYARYFAAAHEAMEQHYERKVQAGLYNFQQRFTQLRDKPAYCKHVMELQKILEYYVAGDDKSAQRALDYMRDTLSESPVSIVPEEIGAFLSMLERRLLESSPAATVLPYRRLKNCN